MGGQSEILLLTGGTSGIGRAAARSLAERGVRVLITGRRRTKGEEALSEIQQAHPEGRGSFYRVDFTDLDAVRQLAADVESDYDRLDVLVNNAGTGVPERTLTDDGIEKTFAVNYVAPFLLTNLLGHRLRESTPARVLNTVTVAQHGSAADMRSGDLSDLDAVATGDYDFDPEETPSGPGQFDPDHAYVNSKLALLLFTYELADRFAGTGLTAACFHPGLVGATDISRHMPLTYKLRFHLGALAARLKTPLGLVFDDDTIAELMTEAEAGELLVAHALDSGLPDGEGVYFDQWDREDPGPRAHDETLREQLWEYTAELADCAETTPSR